MFGIDSFTWLGIDVYGGILSGVVAYLLVSTLLFRKAQKYKSQPERKQHYRLAIIFTIAVPILVGGSLSVSHLETVHRNRALHKELLSTVVPSVRRQAGFETFWAPTLPGWPTFQTVDLQPSVYAKGTSFLRLDYENQSGSNHSGVLMITEQPIGQLQDQSNYCQSPAYIATVNATPCHQLGTTASGAVIFASNTTTACTYHDIDIVLNASPQVTNVAAICQALTASTNVTSN